MQKQRKYFVPSSNLNNSNFRCRLSSTPLNLSESLGAPLGTLTCLGMPGKARLEAFIMEFLFFFGFQLHAINHNESFISSKDTVDQSILQFDILSMFWIIT